MNNEKASSVFFFHSSLGLGVVKRGEAFDCNHLFVSKLSVERHILKTSASFLLFLIIVIDTRHLSFLLK